MVLGNNGKANGKSWIHSPESLINGKVTYTVKFVGKAEVPEPRGMAMVKMALKKLDFSRQLKRTEGTKPPKVELGISIHSVSISDIKTKELLHNISLHRVSFCADDKEDKRLFAFIAKLEDDKHYCYGLDSLHQANDITLTIGQAFELAYDKFVKDNPSAAAPKKLTDMSKRIQELEFENSELRRRIAQLEAGSKPLTNPGLTSGIQQVVPKAAPRTSPVPQGTSNIAIPRRTNQFTTSGTGQKQEVIDSKTKHDVVANSELHETAFPSFSTKSGASQFHVSQNGITSSPNRLNLADTTYASVNHGGKCATLPPRLGIPAKDGARNACNTEENVSSKKFRENLQVSSKRNQRLSDKSKKNKGPLFPAKILSKKLKQIIKENKTNRESCNFDEMSASSCSTPSSSAYANLDDIIATLQKMMSKSESKPKQNGNLPSQPVLPADLIGEKLATCHDANQYNYDRLMGPFPGHLPKSEPPPLPSRVTHATSKGMHPSVSPESHSSTIRQSEFGNSNDDDVSSLSTTSHDSSSTENVYTLQPISSIADSYDVPKSLFRNSGMGTQSTSVVAGPFMDRWGASHGLNLDKPKPNGGIPAAAMNTNSFSYQSTPHTDSVMDTLRQLSGEEGYMVLSGRDRAALQEGYPGYGRYRQEPCFDNTYESVNRLMEAVREAAGKDAQKERISSVLSIPTMSSSSRLTKRPSVFEKESKPPASQVLRSLSTGRSSNLPPLRPPSMTSLRTDCASVTSAETFGSSLQDYPSLLKKAPPHMPATRPAYGGSTRHPAQRPLRYEFHTSISSPFSSSTLADDQNFPLRSDLHMLRETDILHNQTPGPPPLRYTAREDAFNMQPFVPTNSIAKLPQPPSRKSPKQQVNLWSSEDLFSPFGDQKVSRELQEMQKQIPAFEHRSLGTSPPDVRSGMYQNTNKKSNYHIVSHPLIRKKKSCRNTATALKWSKKYFPVGKKKSSKHVTTKHKAQLDSEFLSSLAANFNRGLAMSEGEITLDSFDPLKH